MILPRMNRRDALLAALTLGAGMAVSRTSLSAGGGATLTKAIPSSGQRIPAIGIGTNKYDVTAAGDIAPLHGVLEQLPMLGGAVVDTAPLYGQAEGVIGGLIADLHNRDRLFLATKVMTADTKAGEASMEESMRRLNTQHIDLMQIHNLVGVEAMIPVLQAWKKAGRIGYFGITTSQPNAHGQMMDYMRRLPMDFIQVDYSLANRAAAQEVLRWPPRKVSQSSPTHPLVAGGRPARRSRPR
ncbi:MAG: aldo/keto reductase [Steroidobacteraceae bacterium]